MATPSAKEITAYLGHVIEIDERRGFLIYDPDGYPVKRTASMAAARLFIRRRRKVAA